MFNDTVTIFNYYNEKYYPRVLNGVDVQAINASSLSKLGVTSEDSVTLHIPSDVGKTYVKPLSWAQGTSEFTVNAKNKRDFFIVGTYAETDIDDNSSAYPNGFLDYMKSTCDDVYLISSVASYDAIPHIEVGGK